MPRPARTLTLQTVPTSLSEQEVVRRCARATALLLQIAARLEQQPSTAPQIDDKQTDERKTGDITAPSSVTNRINQ